jgi:uncharacterized protein (TIGR04255 family)
MAVSWRPIHPNHAIERTRIVVQFTDELPRKTIQKLGEAFDAQRAQFGFGPRSEIKSLSFSLNVDEPSMPVAMPDLQPSGWQYNREVGKGAIAEAVTLKPEGLVYENTDYVRWAGFWERSSGIIQPLVSEAASITDFKLFALEYFDRFVFVGSPRQADPSLLVSDRLVNTLPNSARDGGEPWHIHRGWFETIDGIRVLINQNLDAQDGFVGKGKPSRSVGIYTKVERRDQSDTVDANQFKEDMKRMHDISKMVFSDAISDEAHEMIGLGNDPRD